MLDFKYLIYMTRCNIMQPRTWPVVCMQPSHRIQPFRFPHSALIALIRFLSMNGEIRWIIVKLDLAFIVEFRHPDTTIRCSNWFNWFINPVLKLLDCRQTTLENLQLPCQPHSWMLHLSTSHLVWWIPFDVCTFVGTCPGQVSYPKKKHVDRCMCMNGASSKNCSSNKNFILHLVMWTLFPHLNDPFTTTRCNIFPFFQHLWWNQERSIATWLEDTSQRLHRVAFTSSFASLKMG